MLAQVLNCLYCSKDMKNSSVQCGCEESKLKVTVDKNCHWKIREYIFNSWRIKTNNESSS